jgi:diguanylate cyclase (GGDEF)-like protein/putative nucleotidyltransferase with HDIG domain
MHAVAVALIIPWRHFEPYLNNIGLRGRKMSSSGGFNGSELAVAVQNARTEEQSVEEATADGVTGLKTHRYFLDELDEEWRRSTRTGRRFSLAMVGLDRFEHLNDRLRHVERDKLLAAAASLLEAGAKPPNVVARYSADEFAILMPATNTRQAEILAEGLRAAMEADDLLGAHGVTASFGIATFPDDGRTQVELLKAAAAGIELAEKCNGNSVKVASPSVKLSDGERGKRLLEAYLEAAPDGTSRNSPDTLYRGRCHFEPMRPLVDTITALAFAVDAGDPSRRDHSQMVSRLAAQIAIQLRLPQAEVEEIRLAGLVHDVGKVRVPESVYNKHDLLTGEEYEVVRSHASCGAKILERLNVKGVEQIVRHHHERYDGKGYPDGLAGDEIPMGARIVAVAECFHSMISDLSYKSACTFEDALGELRLCSGTQFDPGVVGAFLDWAEACRNSLKQE